MTSMPCMSSCARRRRPRRPDSSAINGRIAAPGEAGAWKNLWQRPDQQAAQALHEGHPEEAQRLARDPAWRGVAAYRAGDYAAAAAELQHAHGGDAAYNRGNAL